MNSRKALALVAVIALVAAVCGCAKRGPEPLFTAAKDLQNKAQYDKSIVKFQEFIAKYPTSKLAPYAMYEIGLSYEKFGKKDLALRQFDEVIAKAKGSDAAKWAEEEKAYISENMKDVPAEMKPEAPKGASIEAKPEAPKVEPAEARPEAPKSVSTAVKPETPKNISTETKPEAPKAAPAPLK